MKSILKYFHRSSIKSGLCYDTCKVLPLKIFFDICETGDLTNLILEGEVSQDELSEIWENIVQEYGRLDGNLAVSNTFEKTSEVVRNMAEYLEIMGMLMYLQEIGVKTDYVDRLKDLGYTVTLTSDYLESIQRSKSRVKGIITRVNILKAELDGMSKDGNKSSFDHAISHLAASLTMWIPDDITVSRYLELKKVVNERNKATGRNS